MLQKISEIIKCSRRCATPEDFRAGVKLYDQEGNEFVLDRQVLPGIWETRSVSGGKIISEIEAKFYNIEE